MNSLSIKYTKFNLKDISDDIRKALRSLTYRDGSMREYLKKSEAKWNTDVDVVMATDLVNKKIVGWSTSDPMADRGLYTLNIFVNPKYRNQGIGKNMIKKQLEYNPKIKRFQVTTHDKTSHTFYSKLGGKREFGTSLSSEPKKEKEPYGGGRYYDAYIGRKTILNPITKNKILVKTALEYPQEHPAHKAALKAIGK